MLKITTDTCEEGATEERKMEHKRTAGGSDIGTQSLDQGGPRAGVKSSGWKNAYLEGPVLDMRCEGRAVEQHSQPWA